MYAIIATGGKQYKVSEGDVISVEKLEGEAGSTVTFDRVIAVSDETLKVGGDVAGVTVSGTVVEQGRVGRSLYTNTRAKPATTRKTVTGRHIRRSRLTKSMRNPYDDCSDLQRQERIL